MDCSRSTAKSVRECFRIGGDEFTVILKDKKLQEKEYRGLLEEMVSYHDDCFAVHGNLYFIYVGKLDHNSS